LEIDMGLTGFNRARREAAAKNDLKAASQPGKDVAFSGEQREQPTDRGPMVDASAAPALDTTGAATQPTDTAGAATEGAGNTAPAAARPAAKKPKAK
jgi:hypothetical protein